MENLAAALVTASESAAWEQCPACLLERLDELGQQRVLAAYQALTPLRGARSRLTGEPLVAHAIGTASLAAELGLDAQSRAVALLFVHVEAESEALFAQFEPEVGSLLRGLQQLMRWGQLYLRQLDVGQNWSEKQAAQQLETLRRMLLAMADDLRVVILRLASRVQTMRWLVASGRTDGAPWGRETLKVFAPLANRLGIWQLKWEMEDLGFRLTQPEVYRRIARLLDEKRVERERFVTAAIEHLLRLMSEQGIKAEVSGRPKHIYSIWNKMRGKNLEFEQLYDLRAFRVIVHDIRACYAVLGIVHQVWQPIPKEFDDYIARPKANGYQSLHTIVTAEDGRPIEIQIRTQEMHRFAEFGVAAHWRYKEGGGPASAHDARIAWMRQLIQWRSELAREAPQIAAEDSGVELRSPILEDRVYVLTPQGQIIDLPTGSTPLDFAYHVHTHLGHRCRGAKVDGKLVALNQVLQTGQTVEIMAIKEGGPSLDWLNPDAAYLVSARAKQKVRQWFHFQTQAEQQAEGRALVEKVLQREGQTAIAHDLLAQKLGFADANALFLACARDEVGVRDLESALRQPVAPPEDLPSDVETLRPLRTVRPPEQLRANSDVLVVGVDRLMTQLAKCCKPAPPDGIVGFVTRGRGVSIHRRDCTTLQHLLARSPERAIDSSWGEVAGGLYPVDLSLLAEDRAGLLRDVLEVMSRLKVNLSDVVSHRHGADIVVKLTVLLSGAQSLSKTLADLGQIAGVVSVRRA